MNRRTAMALAAVLTCGAAAGCSRGRASSARPWWSEGEDTSSTTVGARSPRSRGGGPFDTAPTLREGLETYVQARCELETRCGNVGAQRRYESVAECERRVRANKVQE